MKIGFFLENNKAGGLDTFVINLLNFWPNKKDELILFVNSNHPGLKNLKLLLRKKIVSVFDHQLGMGGMMSEKDLNNYLISFFNISKKFKNINFIFKSKFTSMIFNKILEKIKLTNSIKKNFYILTDSDIEAYELMAISDMVISFPHSSIIDEALTCNIKTIIYDPYNRYSSKNFWYNKIPNLRINSRNELIKKIEYLYKNKTSDKINIQYAKLMDINLRQNYIDKILKELK